MLYTLSNIGFISLSIICIYIIFRILNRTDISYKTGHDRLTRWFLPGIIIWIGLVTVLSLTGFTSDFSNFPPRMFLVLLVPLGFVIWALNSTAITQLLKIIPPQWLFYIQGFRFIVEILLWMLYLDQLVPIQMTFEGRNYDILIGITGPIVGYLCFTNQRFFKKIGLIWNFAGLVVLMNILFIAVLSMPSPMRLFMNEPANTIVATFPTILLPAILVPIAYSMHLFSIKQLINMSEPKRIHPVA